MRVTSDEPRPIGDEEFFDVCMANPDLRIERNARGEIVIVPPAGGESDYRSLSLGAQLKNWALRDGMGKAFGSTACFLLPDGAGLSPDAAWVSNATLAKLAPQARKRFMPVVPEFVVEVMSPSDRLKDAHEKMEQWIRNGVSLGWLVDGDSRMVYVYRRGQSVLKHASVDRLAAGEPLGGFVPDLSDVWSGF